MQIVMTTFVSLDGVYQGPGSPDEDRTGGFERGGWLVPFVDSAFEQQATEWTATATGFLLGRRTYEAFAAVWPTITDPSDQNAAQLNTLTKHVVSTTHPDTPWGPASTISHDILGQIGAMKLAGEGELQIHGSGTLGRSLLDAGLVDLLRLVVAPVIVGQGRRLFGESERSAKLDLLATKKTPKGLIMNEYRPSGDLHSGTYVRGETNRADAPRSHDEETVGQ